MIPQFPSFKKIDLSDKKEIQSCTNRFKPYSDFNFTSLWSWDIDGERRASFLNGNLVIYFTDYDTNAPFLSFLGINDVEKTIVELMSWTKNEGLSSTLSLIPQEVINHISENSDFYVKEDVNNFDYIFNISELSYLKGRKYKVKRNLSKIFLNNNPNAVFKVLKYDDINNTDNLLSLVENWERNKMLKNKTYTASQEKSGIKRLLSTLSKTEEIIISTLIIDGKIKGFSIDEILNNEYAVSHFIKADISYRGIYEFMNEKIAEYLHNNSVVFWNWEQDLGIEGLRSNKSSYRPVGFLKKYKIMQK